MVARKSGDLGGKKEWVWIGKLVDGFRQRDRLRVSWFRRLVGVVVHLEGNGERRFVAFKGVLAQRRSRLNPWEATPV